MEKGYFLSPFHFPAAPLNCSGIRALISLYQSPNDIKGLLKALKEVYDQVLSNRGITMEDLLKHYKTEKQEEPVTV
jgi:hypothetical protein